MSRTARQRLFINVGCGPRGSAPLPPLFQDWRELRVDMDPAVRPDVVANLTDLSGIEAGSADGLWAAHCVEHLYLHEVPQALSQFHRVLREDGFACITVPDLQAVAQHVAADRLHQPLYQADAGPVTAHDVLFGFGAAIAGGRTSMAHRCGFTPGMLQQCFRGQPFAEVLLRRRPAQFELVALARVNPSRDAEERNRLLAALAP